jgi:hypothetical protein
VNEPDGRVNEPLGRVNEPDGRVNEPDGRVKVGTAIPAALRHAATVGSEKGLARPAPLGAALELAAAAVVAAAVVEAVEPPLDPHATTPAPVATIMPTSNAGRTNACILGPPRPGVVAIEVELVS